MFDDIVYDLYKDIDNIKIEDLSSTNKTIACIVDAENNILFSKKYIGRNLEFIIKETINCLNDSKEIITVGLKDDLKLIIANENNNSFNNFDEFENTKNIFNRIRYINIRSIYVYNKKNHTTTSIYIGVTL